MDEPVAALPMYDWPEERADVDALWHRLRDRLRAAGVPAPERLARRNADLPPVPGGIRDETGAVIAPDPATLLADDFDLPTLWRHPALLLAQTCWGPMQAGLGAYVRVVGQPDYGGYAGGQGTDYSSAILMRARDAPNGTLAAPLDGRASIPMELLRGRHFAFNGVDSMSGILALRQDLEAGGETLSVFASLVETGSHRASARRVAEGQADAATIDCRSWATLQRHEPLVAEGLRVVGWTARRKGLPFITRLAQHEATLRAVLEGH